MLSLGESFAVDQGFTLLLMEYKSSSEAEGLPPAVLAFESWLRVVLKNIRTVKVTRALLEAAHLTGGLEREQGGMR
jgi:hypothetical protein